MDVVRVVRRWTAGVSLAGVAIDVVRVVWR